MPRIASTQTDPAPAPARRPGIPVADVAARLGVDPSVVDGYIADGTLRVSRSNTIPAAQLDRVAATLERPIHAPAPATAVADLADAASTQSTPRGRSGDWSDRFVSNVTGTAKRAGHLARAKPLWLAIGYGAALLAPVTIARTLSGQVPTPEPALALERGIEGAMLATGLALALRSGGVSNPQPFQRAGLALAAGGAVPLALTFRDSSATAAAKH